MKSIPQVQKYMTFVPKTISFDQSLEQANNYMRTLHVRHLPVTKAGKVVGVVSDRDINFVLTFKDADARTVKVEQAMTVEPYHTTPDAPLDEVAALMCEKKYCSALVMDNGKLVGIFTTLDALRALSDILKMRHAG